MTDKILVDRITLVSALENIYSARLCDCNSMSSRQEMMRLMGKARDDLRAALEKQEPVCKCDFRTRTVGDGCAVCNPELARELSEPEPVHAIDTKQERVEETAKNEHEPVAWITIEEDGTRHGLQSWSDGTHREVPLYTAPPPREWVSLTDDEIQEQWLLTPQNDKAEGLWFGHRIEAALREKNGGGE